MMTALSPASTRSIAITWRKAVIAPGDRVKKSIKVAGPSVFNQSDIAAIWLPEGPVLTANNMVALAVFGKQIRLPGRIRPV
jgi:hypothetical protein